MQNDYNPLARHHRWRADNAFSRNQVPLAIQSLVIDKGSLTAILVELSHGDFNVNVLAQRWAIPYFHEQQKLQRPGHRIAMIREVELLIGGEPVVYARSIIPARLLTKIRGGLSELGSTPLGQLLFRDGRMRISRRDFAHIDYGSARIYARRTPYDYQGSQILVSEFFLPSLSKYLAR